MQNFLPQETKEIFLGSYKSRRIIVMSLAFLAALMVSSVIFICVLFIAHNKKEAALQIVLESAAAQEEQKQVLAGPKVVNRYADTALSFQNTSSIYEKIAALKEVAAMEISLNGFSYLPQAENSKNTTMVVSGLAANRSALLNFEKAVQALDFVKRTRIPVESFASDTDLPFSLTIDL